MNIVFLFVTNLLIGSANTAVTNQEIVNEGKNIMGVSINSTMKYLMGIC